MRTIVIVRGPQCQNRLSKFKSKKTCLLGTITKIVIVSAKQLQPTRSNCQEEEPKIGQGCAGNRSVNYADVRIFESKERNKKGGFR